MYILIFFINYFLTFLYYLYLNSAEFFAIKAPTPPPPPRLPPHTHPRNAQALGIVCEWSVRQLGVGPLRAKQSKRVLNVRHVVDGALNRR